MTTDQNVAPTTSELAGSGTDASDATRAEHPVQTAAQPPPRDEGRTSIGPPATPSSADADAEAEGDTPAELALLGDSEAGEYRSKWESVQIGFVDEPRAAVEQADKLVAEVMQQLARRFAEERSRLEAQWTSGGEVGTEELRVALRRYRSFFHRLLEQ